MLAVYMYIQLFDSILSCNILFFFPFLIILTLNSDTPGPIPTVVRNMEDADKPVKKKTNR